jgi:hypothetical protein
MEGEGGGGGGGGGGRGWVRGGGFKKLHISEEILYGILCLQ